LAKIKKIYKIAYGLISHNTQSAAKSKRPPRIWLKEKFLVTKRRPQWLCSLSLSISLFLSVSL